MGIRIDHGGYVRHTEDPSRMAWEHIRVAETKLHRKLGITEQVHHINGDRHDNRPENIMVLRTNGDHKRLHAKNLETEVFQTSDGSCVVVLKQRICPQCNRPFVPQNGRQVFCTLRCRKADQSKRLPTKTELDGLLHTEKSMCAIARKFGVTDNAVRKWCVKYQLPLKVYKTSVK